MPEAAAERGRDAPDSLSDDWLRSLSSQIRVATSVATVATFSSLIRGPLVFKKWCARQESNLLPCGPETRFYHLEGLNLYSNQWCPVSSFGVLSQARCYIRCYSRVGCEVVSVRSRDSPLRTAFRGQPRDCSVLECVAVASDSALFATPSRPCSKALLRQSGPSRIVRALAGDGRVYGGIVRSHAAASLMAAYRIAG